MMSLLASSGLRWVFIGAESGHDKVLELMERDHTVAHILAAAEKLARHKIKATFSFNVGYPQEPDDNFSKTAALCRELCAINPETEIMVYITTAYEATPSFHRAQEVVSLGATQGRAGGPDTMVSTNGPVTGTLENWKHLDQRRGEDKPWLGQRYQKKLHNFSLATFYATSFLHRRWRVTHRLNPLVRLLGSMANLHMRVGFYESILDLRVLNRLFMKISQPTRKIDMWTGR